MSDLIIRPGHFLEQLNKFEPCRITRELNNGNLAILQIVNTEDVPAYVKWLRDKKGFIACYIRSLEAAFRVGRIVFNNSMRKKRR